MFVFSFLYDKNSKILKSREKSYYEEISNSLSFYLNIKSSYSSSTVLSPSLTTMSSTRFIESSSIFAKCTQFAPTYKYGKKHIRTKQQSIQQRANSNVSKLLFATFNQIIVNLSFVRICFVVFCKCSKYV